MPYIYKITNSVNNRSYIGATSKTPKRRWKEHLFESKRERASNRPLYEAIKKYGEEAFVVSVVEECSAEDLDQREIYWISYYDTFRNGYNATYGGKGKHCVDYDLVYETYLHSNMNCKEISKALNVDEGLVSAIVRTLSGMKRLPRSQAMTKRVNMYNKSGEYIKTFSSVRSAARYLLPGDEENIKRVDNLTAKICCVCKGKRKTAGGHIWEYAD